MKNVGNVPLLASWFMRGYTSLAAFLLMSLALVVPSGYSLGALMLLLGSLVLLLIREPMAFVMQRREWLIVAVFSAYAVVVIAEAWWMGSMRAMDRPSRFILAIPALLLLLAYPPRAAALWSGLALGGLLTCAWAIWQKGVLDVSRASGHTYVIQYGNISMLTGVLCLAGLGWAVCQPRARLWVTLLLFGAMGGVLASLLSGTRGGWVGLPVVAWVLYKGYGDQMSGRWRLGAGLVMVAVVVVAYAVPQTGVQHRVERAISDVTRYIDDDRASSLGARFEMWKGAGSMFLERPLTGWGQTGYEKRMLEYAEQGNVDVYAAGFGHAHNEFLDMAAKRGIFGLLAILALYLVPIRLFSRHISQPDLCLRSISVAGVLLGVMYFDFGLSQVFLAHNSGVMIYAFLLPVMWATMRVEESRLA